MRKPGFWMASAVTLALVGCGAEEPPAEQAVQPTEARSEETPAEWKSVAPGIWERARADGGHEQMGIGVQALESELQRLRVQRALLQQVSAMGGTSGALAGHLRESDKRIQFLETHLEEARKEEPLRLALDSSEGTPSGAFCGGYYGFEVEFWYGMAGGSVTTRAGWTEFGPFGPYTKQFYVQATGWVDGNMLSEQTSNSTGPFTATCCVSIETTAAAYPTFAPVLEGVGYLRVERLRLSRLLQGLELLSEHRWLGAGTWRAGRPPCVEPAQPPLRFWSAKSWPGYQTIFKRCGSQGTARPPISGKRS